ncbi:hypothetical protein [Variovorax sp. GT1P44]|uniref:hypothetical protein n=1 Tax=Variovorax sp. GT1P44 TaxID=3443742 RepID=UPI003F462D5F
MSSPSTTLPTPPWMGGDSIGLAAWQRSRHVGIAASPANLSIIGGLTSVHDRHTSFVESLSVHDAQAERVRGDDPRVFRSAVARAVVVRPQDLMRSTSAPRALVLPAEGSATTGQSSADVVEPVPAPDREQVPHADMPVIASRAAVGGIAQPAVLRGASAYREVGRTVDSGDAMQQQAEAGFAERPSERSGTAMRRDAPSVDAGPAQVQRSSTGRAGPAPMRASAIARPRDDGATSRVSADVVRKHLESPLSAGTQVAAIGQVSALRPVSLAVHTAMAASALMSPEDVAPPAAGMRRRVDMQRDPGVSMPLVSQRLSSYEVPAETVSVPKVILRAPSMPLRRASAVAASNDRSAPTLDPARTPAPVADQAGDDRRQDDGIAFPWIATTHAASMTGARVNLATDPAAHSAGAAPAEPRPTAMTATPEASGEGVPVQGRSSHIARHLEAAPVVAPMAKSRTEVEMPLSVGSAALPGEPTTSRKVTQTGQRAIPDVLPTRASTDRAVIARAETVPSPGPVEAMPAERTLPASRLPVIIDVPRTPAVRAMPVARIISPSRIADTDDTTPALARSATTQWRTLVEPERAPTRNSDTTLEHGARLTEAPPGQSLQLAAPAPGLGMPLAELQPRTGLPLSRESTPDSSTTRTTSTSSTPAAVADVGILRHRTAIDRSPSRQELGPADTGSAVPPSAEVHPRQATPVLRSDTIARAQSLVFSNPMQLASVAVPPRAEWTDPHGEDAMPLSHGVAGLAVASGTQTLLRRSAFSSDTDPPEAVSDTLQPFAIPFPGERPAAHHPDAGTAHGSRRMPLFAAPLQRRMAVNGASPDFTSRAAPAIARIIDMPLVRPGAPAPAGSASSSQIARVAEPRMAHPDSGDAWSPDAAAPPSAPTTAHQVQPEQRGAQTAVDVDDLVERAWGALMSRLATEHERRGFARWA